FSWRPLDAKFSSAIQKGVIYLTLLASGLFRTVISDISLAEQKMAAEISANPSSAEDAQETAQLTIDKLIDGVSQSSRIILGVGMIGSIVACIIVAWAICHWGYKLDEEQYAKIVGELEIRHKQDEAAAEAKTAATVGEALAK
ncbi:MAG: hypothetical protein WCS90_04390, partial [Bacilli bacterium]